MTPSRPSQLEGMLPMNSLCASIEEWAGRKGIRLQCFCHSGLEQKQNFLPATSFLPCAYSGIECDHTLSHLLLRNLLQKNNSIQPRCDLFTSRHGDVESDHIWPQPLGKGVPDAALQRMVPGRTMRQRGASGDVVRLDSLVLLSP